MPFPLRQENLQALQNSLFSDTESRVLSSKRSPKIPIAEVTLTSEIPSPNAFLDVTLDVLITAPDAQRRQRFALSVDATGHRSGRQLPQGAGQRSDRSAAAF